jgi:hexosaminidase
MKNLWFALPFCLLSFVSFSQRAHIIPQPSLVIEHVGEFPLTAAVPVVFTAPELERSANYLMNHLDKTYGLKLSGTNQPINGSSIELRLQQVEKPVIGGYNLEVSFDKIVLSGHNEEGVFYGIQTLIQLLPTQKTPAFSIPNITITDAPRFVYRGVHLDVSRHFFPKEYIKRYLDYLALHKMNTFHWHLTDDQGWRIEIKKYPKLTEVGAWRSGTLIGKHPGKGYDTIRYGGFYTQDDIREVVQYAADRYITVIPEIELPGHSMAAIAAYPELSTTPTESKAVARGWVNFGAYEYNNVLSPNAFTFQFLEDVLTEVIELFPSNYIHIGGDECSKRWWKESSFCQQFMKENNLKDEKALQSYFINRVEKFLNSKGRNIIGWNEILQGGLAPNATVMSWQGIQGGITAARKKHKVIMTPGNACYFDHPQTVNDDSIGLGKAVWIDSVYKYEPLPKALTAAEHRYILGAQANVWTEYIATPSKLEYMLFPRLSALSEVVWSDQKQRNWNSFQTRMGKQFKRYELWGINFSPELLKRSALVKASYNTD